MDTGRNPIQSNIITREKSITSEFTILHNDIKFQTDKLCLFASYNFTESVADYILHYLSALQKEDYTIVFITTSKLKEACLQQLKTYCSLIIERENKGLDFASWQCGLRLHDFAANCKEVLLANDSVFGPFQNLGPIFSTMNKRYDIWGMTDNYDIDYHIQSYFLHFNEKVIKSDTWLSFWKNMNTDGLPKDEIIRRFEVGLSTSFLKAGFKLGVYSSIDTLIRSAGGNDREISPPLVYWQPLIEKFNFPFLKRELLINTSIGKAYWHRNIYINTSNWRKVIEQGTSYDVQLIDSFLKDYYQSLSAKNPRIQVKQKKIIFVAHSTEARDALKVFLSFLKWMRKHTNIPFEVIVATPSDSEELLDDVANICAVTRFWKLNEAEKYELKERLSGESVGLVFSNTLLNVDVQQYLSFLQVPQIVYVHEMPDTRGNISYISNNKSWLKENIAHYIVYTESIKEALRDYLRLPGDVFSIVPPFIEDGQKQKPVLDTKAVLHQLNLPYDSFFVGVSGKLDPQVAVNLIPAIATMLCKKYKDIHIVWLGADTKNPLFSNLENDLRKADIIDQVHFIPEQESYDLYYGLLNVFLMPSKEDTFPLLNLEVGLKGVPVICFENKAATMDYFDMGIGTSVPYLDLGAMRDAVLNYYHNREQLKGDAARISSGVSNNFVASIQAPKIYNAIKTCYDENELVPVEHPSKTIMTHIFYDNTWKDLKYKLNFFKDINTQFLFSISEACLIKDELEKDIRASFPGAYVLTTSNIGKDIGGKFALIDLYLSLKLESDFIIFLHDKQSPHSLIGDSWKNNLQKIVDYKNYKQIVKTFEQDENVGVIGAREHLISEYDATNHTFLNNNDLIHVFLKKYNIAINNYEFFGGTMYWMRANIIENFFTSFNPMQIRSELEAGNVLDNHGSTNAHTWERVLSWVATNQGYKLRGI